MNNTAPRQSIRPASLRVKLLPLTLFLSWMIGYSSTVFALSDAPLRILSSYIASNHKCSEQITEWNLKNGQRAIAGEISRDLYYRVLGYMDWGACGRPYFKRIFIELQKVWMIYSKGLAKESEYIAKESELINLLFASMQAGEQGEAMVTRYEQNIAGKLFRLEPERQYFNCTYFGDQPKCTD
jgi:hypothetical protein